VHGLFVEVVGGVQNSVERLLVVDPVEHVGVSPAHVIPAAELLDESGGMLLLEEVAGNELLVFRAVQLESLDEFRVVGFDEVEHDQNHLESVFIEFLF